MDDGPSSGNGFAPVASFLKDVTTFHEWSFFMVVKETRIYYHVRKDLLSTTASSKLLSLCSVRRWWGGIVELEECRALPGEAFIDVLRH